MTDIDTSDAAVRRPADVHYPVITDHVYAGKHEIELDKQVEEDSQSLDLFLSLDELSEESQPRHRQSDWEYNVSSSGPSQSNRNHKLSTDNH